MWFNINIRIPRMEFARNFFKLKKLIANWMHKRECEYIGNWMNAVQLLNVIKMK